MTIADLAQMRETFVALSLKAHLGGKKEHDDMMMAAYQLSCALCDFEPDLLKPEACDPPTKTVAKG